MERLVIEVSGNLVTRPPVAQVVLSLPRWIHDQGIRPGDDLPGKEADRECRLDDLVPLGALSRIVDRIGQEPSCGSEVRLSTVAIAFEHGVLKVKRHVAGRCSGPVLAGRTPLTAGQRDPVFRNRNRTDGPGFRRTGGPADVHLSLGLVGSSHVQGLVGGCVRLRVALLPAYEQSLRPGAEAPGGARKKGLALRDEGLRLGRSGGYSSAGQAARVAGVPVFGTAKTGARQAEQGWLRLMEVRPSGSIARSIGGWFRCRTRRSAGCWCRSRHGLRGSSTTGIGLSWLNWLYGFPSSRICSCRRIDLTGRSLLSRDRFSHGDWLGGRSREEAPIVVGKLGREAPSWLPLAPAGGKGGSSSAAGGRGSVVDFESVSRATPEGNGGRSSADAAATAGGAVSGAECALASFPVDGYFLGPFARVEVGVRQGHLPGRSRRCGVRSRCLGRLVRRRPVAGVVWRTEPFTGAGITSKRWQRNGIRLAG